MLNQNDRNNLAGKLLVAAREAAAAVMRVYADADVGTTMKGPNDPVTRADKEANALILAALARDFPGIPVVAEESPPADYENFAAAETAFFVDPVDGTREFIAKNGEFCVMIGFAEEARATVGIVLCPAIQKTYVGVEGKGAFLVSDDDTWTPIHVSPLTDIEQALCAVSRFHRSGSVDQKLQRLKVRELVPIGSAGLKGVRVAEGAVQLYAHPSTGLVKLWDACAPDAVVRAAGGVLTDGSGKPFDYRGAVAQGEGTIAGSKALHAEALRRIASVPEGARA